MFTIPGSAMVRASQHGRGQAGAVSLLAAPADLFASLGIPSLPGENAGPDGSPPIRSRTLFPRQASHDARRRLSKADNHSHVAVHRAHFESAGGVSHPRFEAAILSTDTAQLLSERDHPYQPGPGGHNRGRDLSFGGPA